MANELTDYIIVTNWDKVDKHDFYLSKEWEPNCGKDTMRKARQLQREGKLCVAYRVAAVIFAIYSQMDADKIFINDEGEEIMSCETEVIDDDFYARWQDENV